MKLWDMNKKQDVSLYICAFNWSDRKCINTTSNLYMYEKCVFHWSREVIFMKQTHTHTLQSSDTRIHTLEE